MNVHADHWRPICNKSVPTTGFEEPKGLLGKENPLLSRDKRAVNLSFLGTVILGKALAAFFRHLISRPLAPSINQTAKEDAQFSSPLPRKSHHVPIITPSPSLEWVFALTLSDDEKL